MLLVSTRMSVIAIAGSIVLTKFMMRFCMFLCLRFTFLLVCFFSIAKLWFLFSVLLTVRHYLCQINAYLFTMKTEALKKRWILWHTTSVVATENQQLALLCGKHQDPLRQNCLPVVQHTGHVHYSCFVVAQPLLFAREKADGKKETRVNFTWKNRN